jgi:hypothetical protein
MKEHWLLIVENHRIPVVKGPFKDRPELLVESVRIMRENDSKEPLEIFRLDCEGFPDVANITPCMYKTRTPEQCDPFEFVVTEETKQYIVTNKLTKSISWLCSNIPTYFGDVTFDIEHFSLDDEDGDIDMLALKIYGSFATSDFRSRRQQLCRDLRNKGYRKLDKYLTIFQRTQRQHG